MATSARQQQKGRKNEPQGQANRRAPNAWGQPNRNSGAYSPAPNNRPLANASSPAPASSNTTNASTAPTANAVGSNGTFPPLNGSSAPTSTPASRSDAERTLQSLAGLTGTTVTISLRNGPRFEGVVDSTAQAGDTPGLTLRDARDVNIAGSPIKDRQFIAAANIASWLSGPAGTKPTTAPNGDSFKTDVDISFKAAPRRERELQAWADDSVGLDLSPGGANHSPGATIGHGDDTTFGAGASRNTGWDQFATNEKLFGVKAGFDEEAYTTKLNRDAPDFKERERKAQQLANEIMNSGSHNPHVAEERVMNLTGDNGINEEDKHAAVVRGPGAYVPPAARKGSGGAVGVVNLPKVSVNAPDGTPAPLLSANANATRTSGPPSTATTPAAVPTSTSTPGASTPAATTKGTAGAATPEGAFRDFVSHEKKRLAEKKQTMMRKDMEARFADLMSFSKSFKLKQPLPEDLVPILAKDEDKQAAIRDKALADASAVRSPGAGGASAGGPIAASQSTATNPVRLDAAHAKAGGVPSAVSTKTAVPAKAVDKKKPAMFIQPIPAFKGKKTSTDSTPAGSAGGSAVVSPQLNQNAPSFRPNPKAVAFSPTPGQPAGASGGKQGAPQTQSGPSPKPARAVADAGASTNAGAAATHPFFGRPPKKPAGPVSIRDDFNPFKHNKVAEPSAVGNNWPYSGKRFMHHYPVGPSNPGAAGPGGGPGGGGPGGPGGPGMQNGLGMIGGPGNALNISMQPPGHVPHIHVPPGATPNMQGVPLPGVGGPPGGPNNITASPNMHVAQHIMQQQPGGPQGPGGGPGFDEDPAQAAARVAAQQAQAAQAGQYMFYPPHYYPGQPMMPGMPPPPQPGYMPGPYMQMYPPMGPNGQPMYAASPQMGQMPLAPPYGMPPPGAYPPPNGRGPSMPPTPMPHNAHAHTYYQPSPQMQHAVPYPMMMPPPGQQMGVPPGGPGAPPPPGQGGPPPQQGHYEQPGQQGGPQQMGVPHA